MTERDLQPVRVVVGILIRDDKILIAQRPVGKPYSGYWEFPGGKIEANESAKEALQRELREELRIDVIQAQSWFSYAHSYPEKTVLLAVWLVTEFLGEPHGNENQILHWASFAEISEWRLLEGNNKIINRIKVLLIENGGLRPIG